MEEVGPAPELFRVFEAFCSFGKGKKDQMEGKTWAKMMKDCGVFDKRFTTTSADIIFSKAKPKGERVIRINDFCRALQLVAQEKSVAYEELLRTICASEGPNSSGRDDRLVHRPIHSSHSFIRPIHSFVPYIRPFLHSSIHSFVPFIHSSHSFIRPIRPIHSFGPFIHSSIHSFVHSPQTEF